MLVNILFTLLLFSVEIKALPNNMYESWLRSQVAIYDRAKNYEKYQPNCFGNLLTPKHAITAASCFMDVKSILKLSETYIEQPSKEEQDRILFKSINVNIIDFIVLRVISLTTSLGSRS